MILLITAMYNINTCFVLLVVVCPLVTEADDTDDIAETFLDRFGGCIVTIFCWLTREVEMGMNCRCLFTASSSSSLMCGVYRTLLSCY